MSDKTIELPTLASVFEATQNAAPTVGEADDLEVAVKSKALSKWGDEKFDNWCRRMAKVLSSPRDDLVGKFRDRWGSIWDLGRWLAEFEDDDDFRGRVFDGKTSCPA